MFDRIVLRAMRWIVRNANGQTREIRKSLQPILEANASATARSTAVEQRQEAFRAAILMDPMMTPPIQHRINHKITGVVAGVQMDVSFVPPHVVEAVRNDNARSVLREIMIPTPQRGRREHSSGTHIIAENLPFFAVNRQNRKTGLQVVPLQPSDLLELGVTVSALAHRLDSLRLAVSKAELVQQMVDHRRADLKTLLPQRRGDLAPCQVGPNHTIPHRVASRMRINHRLKRFQQGRSASKIAFSAPLFSGPAPTAGPVDLSNLPIRVGVS